MNVMSWCIAAAAGSMLGGCQLVQQLEPDGLRCDLPRVGNSVSIDIRYAADGTPSAVPDECTVPPDTRIVWRGPAGNATPFTLTFPGGSPAARGGRGPLPSHESGGVQKVVLVTSAEDGRYKYDIAANGRVVDPAIIIKR